MKCHSLVLESLKITVCMKKELELKKETQVQKKKNICVRNSLSQNPLNMKTGVSRVEC